MFIFICMNAMNVPKFLNLWQQDETAAIYLLFCVLCVVIVWVISCVYCPLPSKWLSSGKNFLLFPLMLELLDFWNILELKDEQGKNLCYFKVILVYYLDHHSESCTKGWRENSEVNASLYNVFYWQCCLWAYLRFNISLFLSNK